jgi:hypothetical protein
MAAVLEAEDTALWLNIDIKEGVGRYENQIERESWSLGHCHQQPQPDSDSWPEGQEQRQGGLIPMGPLLSPKGGRRHHG